MKKNARQETGEVVQAGLSMSSSSSSDSSSISVQNAGLCDELEGKKVGELQVQKAIEEDVKRVKDSHNLERTRMGSTLSKKVGTRVVGGRGQKMANYALSSPSCEFLAANSERQCHPLIAFVLAF